MESCKLEGSLVLNYLIKIRVIGSFLGPVNFHVCFLVRFTVSITRFLRSLCHSVIMRQVSVIIIWNIEKSVYIERI